MCHDALPLNGEVHVYRRVSPPAHNSLGTKTFLSSQMELAFLVYLTHYLEEEVPPPQQLGRIPKHHQMAWEQSCSLWESVTTNSQNRKVGIWAVVKW